jgi:hypothetical protein
MAFVCTLTEKSEASFTFGESRSLVVAPIGCDPVTGLSYAIVAGLDQVPGTFEFWFHLVEVDHQTGTETTHWNGKGIARIIPKEDKPKVLSALLGVTEALFLGIEKPPESFFMCTIDADMPEKALEKHELLCQVFLSVGYEVTQMDPYHGQRLWEMHRRA